MEQASREELTPQAREAIILLANNMIFPLAMDRPLTYFNIYTIVNIIAYLSAAAIFSINAWRIAKSDYYKKAYVFLLIANLFALVMLGYIAAFNAALPAIDIIVTLL